MLEGISTEGVVVKSVSDEADANVPSSPYNTLAFTGRDVSMLMTSFLNEFAAIFGSETIRPCGGVGTGFGVGLGDGFGVGVGVGVGDGVGLGEGVGDGDGFGVGFGEGLGEGVGVGDGVGDGAGGGGVGVVAVTV